MLLQTLIFSQNEDPLSSYTARSPRARQAEPRPGLDLLSTRAAATELGVSEAWLEGLRRKGGGPPYYQLSPRKTRYSLSDLKAWLTERLAEQV
jgi:predicted DNA-binding transcriptional regulator AlpA